ncbi:MAG: type transporter [Mucilaginibacter sp.]|nr:type transporter [Mucilaginibacter sp.]
MKVALKIAKAELNTLFYSPIAWLLAIVFLFQCGLTYTGVLQNYLTYQELGGPYLRVLKMLTNLVFTPPSGMFGTVMQKIYLYIPLLTMGLISREISSGTIKLLYSSPIKIRQIVFGKFLAMMGYNLLLILIIFIFVITGLFNIHSADLGLMLSSLFGIYLLLCAYSAIGLFMSSLTSYQIVAAMCTLVIFAALAYVGTIWQDIDFVRDLTYFLSISGRTNRMLLGLISTKDVIYFGLIIYIFLGFCIARLQSQRESKSAIVVAGRYIFIFFSALMVGYITSLPPLVGYYDATAGNQMTLTSNSQKIIAQLGDEPLEVTSYINLLENNYWSGQPEQRNTDLNRWLPYMRFKSNIKLKYVYYYDNPIYVARPIPGVRIAKRKEDENVKLTAQKYAKTFKVDLGDFKTPEEISKIIDLRPELNRYVMQLKFKGKTTFLRLFDDSQVYPFESETDAALKRLISKLPKIAFLDGEYERSKDKLSDKEYGQLTSLITFRNSLVNQGFDVENVSLQTGEIPADISALVIADPKTAFAPAVLAKIQKYIAGGGNLLIAGEPGKQSILNPLLSTLGVQIMDGVLVQKAGDNPPDMLKPLFTKNITNINKGLQKQLTDSVGVSMPGVSGLTYTIGGPFLIKPLLMTDSSQNWNKKGKLVVDSADVVFSAADGDTKAAVPTVLALTRQINHKEQRIIIAGDADFLSNKELSRGRAANFVFGIDVFGWFTYGQFPIDTNRPESEDKHLNVTDKGLITLKVLFLGILPGLLVIIAAVFLIRRKRK